ncbi:hypothetical protein FACS1894151_11400 [Spirochaetia bacterium]|nr:hypothetical protein FACS1894151_11400 [Spirochaetia bacterium]
MENNKNPFNVNAGQIWIENDLRHKKVKIVLSVDEESGYATIQGKESCKITRAKLSRFHGRRGGYMRKKN